MGSNTFFNDASWMNATVNQGYGSLPIPTARDEQITTLIQKWMTLDDVKRQEASASLNEDQCEVLLAYSERMASRAVRELQRDWISTGLIALGLDGGRTDWRENILLLGLHYDACLRIEVSAECVFSDAAKFFSTDIASAFVAFLKRKPADKSLDAMGYKASNDADGFRYERTW